MKKENKRYLNCKYLDAGMDGMLCSKSLCTTCKEFHGEKCPDYISKNKKKTTKTTNWLTKDMTQEEIKKIKEEAIREADKELAQIEEREKQIEKVFDVLNKFEFFYGQRAGRELWADKPVEVQNQDISDFVNNIKYIKDFLNESVILSKNDYESIRNSELNLDWEADKRVAEELDRIEKHTAHVFSHILGLLYCLDFETDNTDYNKGFFDGIKNAVTIIKGVTKSNGIDLKDSYEKV